jgi:Mg-chelatase subunit ChlD
MHSVHSLSTGRNLYSDLAASAHQYLSRNGHTSVETRILLSQLGAALSHLKPADDPAFKWKNVFAAHSHHFQLIDAQSKAGAIYAITAQPQAHRHRVHNHRATPAHNPAPQDHRHQLQLDVVPAPAKASQQSALVPAGPDSASALAMNVAQHGFTGTDTAPTVQQQVDLRHVPRKTSVVVVLDLSGSMSDEAFGRLTPAKEAIMRLWDVLQAGDSLTIITFNTHVTTVMPRRFKWEPKEGQVQRPTQFVRADLQAVVDSLQAGGGTALYHALLQAMHVTRAAAQEDVAKAKAQKREVANTYQLFVITDGMDEDSASIDPASTASAVNEALKRPGGWAGQVKFSSCFVAIGEDAAKTLEPCTNGLNPEHHHTVVLSDSAEKIAEGFRRVTDSFVTVKVTEAQTFSKQSYAFGGAGTGGSAVAGRRRALGPSSRT